MPVELRKRKAHQAPPAPAPAPKKAAGKAAKPAAAKAAKPAATKPAKAAKVAKPAASKAAASSPDEQPAKDEPVEDKVKPNDEPAKDKDKPNDEPAAKPADNKKAGKLAVGDVFDLDGFGGQVETHDGKQTTLKQLVDDSKAGVVLFTYPKASTPGCTTQACLFRDSYEPLTADGLSIYGLSSDSPKANTNFKDKQKLPYPLLCDAQATLIAAIGLKKQPKGTVRGVFAVDKKGKVLVAEAGGPAATVDRIKALVEELKG